MKSLHRICSPEGLQERVDLITRHCNYAEEPEYAALDASRTREQLRSFFREYCDEIRSDSRLRCALRAKVRLVVVLEDIAQGKRNKRGKLVCS